MSQRQEELGSSSGSYSRVTPPRNSPPHSSSHIGSSSLAPPLDSPSRDTPPPRSSGNGSSSGSSIPLPETIDYAERFDQPSSSEDDNYSGIMIPDPPRYDRTLPESSYSSPTSHPASGAPSQSTATEPSTRYGLPPHFTIDLHGVIKSNQTTDDGAIHIEMRAYGKVLSFKTVPHSAEERARLESLRNWDYVQYYEVENQSGEWEVRDVMASAGPEFEEEPIETWRGRKKD
ncbi:hypothetical protein MMC28_006419 [Mycoblastus sanguinarius]|nr:hypothetical protein [Mycoblastus sanguinarius]